MADNRAEALGAVGGAGELTAAPTNSLVQWALIGLLIERASYGYELAQRFERTYGQLLRLSGVSYVYTALDALKRRGLIEEVEVREDDRRMPRVHYRVTSKGVDAYQERLLAQMRENDRRSRLLATQLALLVPEPGLALGVLDRYERECLDEAEHAPVSSPRIASPREGGSQTAERLAAEERRLSLDARLAWVEYARRELRALARTSGRRT
jgi:DNA-binding PadR family transcriptional regulator